MRALNIDPEDDGANRALAVSLGINPGDASQGRQTVARWREGGGRNRPNYEATLLLLEAAGLLADPHAAIPLRRPNEEDAASGRVQQQIVEQMEMQTSLLEDIVAAEERLARTAARIERAAGLLPERAEGEGGPQ